MKRSGKLSVALHALVHLVEQRDTPQTSEALAACLMTNPVVVRRTMGLLREHGLVSASKGHGGGWLLARPAQEITLASVYAALGERLLLAVTTAAGNEQCLIVRSVSDVMDAFLHDAEALLVARLSRITLAQLAADMAQRGGGHHQTQED
jgi:Rrf2 family protein